MRTHYYMIHNGYNPKCTNPNCNHHTSPDGNGGWNCLVCGSKGGLLARFTIPAMPHAWKGGKRREVIDGYYSQGKRPNWKRKKRYEEWKGWVQQYAALAGLELPLRATAERPLRVVTVAHFADGHHPDPENVHKGIVDALCYISKEERKLGVPPASDKYFGGAFSPPQYDAERPRVEVRVELVGPCEGG